MKTKILFVDDEPNILAGLRRMTRSMRSEWEVRFAPSGQEALALLESHPCDVVVSDMRMPGMDGNLKSVPGKTSSRIHSAKLSLSSQPIIYHSVPTL